MSVPLVSIMVTTYHHAAFIGMALDSALAQTYPHVEIIVADDGSTDGTAEIIAAYARRYPARINALPPKVNTGIPGINANPSRALRACRGAYICVLDGDDMYLPHKIETQVAWMEQDERRVLCTHDLQVFDSATGSHLFYVSEKNPLRAGVGAKALVRGRFRPATAGVMFRASAAPPHGWDPSLKIVLDWLFWIECLASGGIYGYVDGIHARYRRHAGSVMRSPQFDQVRLEDQLTTLALVQARYPHLSSSCRAGRADVLFWNALTHLRRENVAAARHLSATAVRERFGFRRLALAVLTRLPERLSKACVHWYVARPAGLAWLIFR